METIIIKTDSVKAKAIKQFLKAFGILFKVKKDKQSPLYDPAFVKMVLERTKSAEEGNVVTIDPNDLWKSIGSR